MTKKVRLIMKLWLLSDLHQEFLRDPSAGKHPRTRFEPLEHAPDRFDVVVAPGDIDVTIMRSLRWLGERFPGLPVIYLPGNHCLYSDPDSEEGPRTYDELLDMGAELADKLGITMLNDSMTTIEGVRFAGGTLWTDMMTVGRGNILAKIKESEGRYGQTDYRAIKRFSSAHPGKRKRFRAQDSMELHRRTRGFLEGVMETPHDGTTVFVTHHAPHPQGLGPNPARLPWADASNLSSMMEADEAPELWLHGHVHGHDEYQVGNTKVVRNARGYLFEKGMDESFVPDLVIDVPPPRPRATIAPQR